MWRWPKTWLSQIKENHKHMELNLLLWGDITTAQTRKFGTRTKKAKLTLLQQLAIQFTLALAFSGTICLVVSFPLVVLGSHHRVPLGTLGRRAHASFPMFCAWFICSTSTSHPKEQGEALDPQQLDHWMSLEEQPITTCPSWEEHTVCLEQKVRGDLWILPAPWWVTAHLVRTRYGEMLGVENRHQKVFKYCWLILPKQSVN